MLHDKQSSGNCQKETIHGVTKEFEKQPRLQNFKLNVTLTCSIICRVIECPSACDQIAFCAFHSILLEVQANGAMHV